MRGFSFVQAMKMAAAFVNSSELAKWVRDLKNEQIELECYCQVCSPLSHSADQIIQLAQPLQ